MDTCSTHAPISKRVGKSGNRWAAWSWVRSGVTGIRGSGLERGLVASRGACRAGHLGAPGSRGEWLRIAERRAASRATGTTRDSDATQQLRRGPRDDHAGFRSRAGDRDESAHYESLFGNEASTAPLRVAYAMKNDTVPDATNRHVLTGFFWWTSWAAMTERPGSAITYTNNWPSEPLIGNRPPSSTYLWSAFSVLFLIAGIALLGWHHAVSHGRAENPCRCRRRIRSRSCASRRR